MKNDPREEFVRYFHTLGYTVTWAQHGTDSYEIWNGRVICRIKPCAPLADFLEDLPHLAMDESGTHTSGSEFKVEADPDELLEMFRRVIRAAIAQKGPQ
jgi:hypothetical protein